ncbi:hypothetical protein [Laspinema palackyanum]|uniref:hypothetical protein n=1 Tax=Laspinema palackyanum TaxID=3231601 RepID=UPI00345CDA2A|nr:hypothetical protein [Laspinema sp. D2c]
MEKFSYRNSAIGFCEVGITKVEGKMRVTVKELPDNPGMSIGNAEDVFMQVCNLFELPPDEVEWVEHWPAWTASQKRCDRPEEDWHRVEFDLVDGRATNPRWTPLNRDKD